MSNAFTHADLVRLEHLLQSHAQKLQKQARQAQLDARHEHYRELTANAAHYTRLREKADQQRQEALAQKVKEACSE